MPAKKTTKPADDELEIDVVKPDDEDMPPGMHLVEEDLDEDEEEEDEVAAVIAPPTAAAKKGGKPVLAPIVDPDEEKEEEEEVEEEIDEDDELKALDILERRLRKEETEPVSSNDGEEDMGI